MTMSLPLLSPNRASSARSWTASVLRRFSLLLLASSLASAQDTGAPPDTSPDSGPGPSPQSGPAQFTSRVRGVTRGSGPMAFPMPSVLTNGVTDAQEILLSNVASQIGELLTPEAAPEGEDGSNAPPDLAAGTNTVRGNLSYDGRPSRRRRFEEERAAQQRRAAGGANPAAGADTNAGPAVLTYDRFQRIAELNIFNPNRRPRLQRPPVPTPPPSEYLTFVGTMTYEKGTFAFFDGSNLRFRKALKLTDTIALFKVAAITADTVKLAQGTNVFDLRMGASLTRQEAGDWRLSSAPAAFTEAPSFASSSSFDSTATRTSDTTATASTSTTTSSTGGGSLDEVRKKMMERREKE